MMLREGTAAVTAPALPSRHPEDSLLMAYAAGSVSEAAALVVATHLALCPLCRAEVGRYEAVGGQLLDEVDPAEVGGGALDQVLAKLNGREPPPEPRRPELAPADGIPQPLRGYLGAPLDALKWSLLLPRVREIKLPLGDAGARISMLKIKAGGSIPQHTHTGAEYTLVLSGAFTDSTGAYNRGDFAFADEALKHQPIATASEDCICLALSEAPMRFTGPFARLLNPLIK
jgi:putative transcriptional regulator